MKIKLNEFYSAVRALTYDFSSYNGEDAASTEVEIELISENPGEGSMVDCIRLKTSHYRPDSSYTRSPDNDTTRQIQTVRILECYDSSTNQRPRMTKQETKEILD